MAPRRTFVALSLPDAIRAALGELATRHLSASTPGLRWGDAAQAHLTLAFLGDLEDDAVAGVRICARRIARDTEPFAADLRAAGAFPSAARARVLWLGWGVGAAPVSALQARLVAALGAAGFALERRRFQPHVTLARSRGSIDLRAAVAALEGWRSEPWTVTAIDVMTSRLTPAGARHTRLERCWLGRRR